MKSKKKEKKVASSVFSEIKIKNKNLPVSSVSSKKWPEKHLLIFLALFSDFLPAHPASFTYNFFSEMQSFYFSESQDAMVLQSYHEK